MSVLSHISKTCSEWDLLHEIFCRPCHLWQHVIYFQFPVCCQLVKFSHDVEYACRPTAYYLVRRVTEFGCECDQSRPDDALICLTLQHYPVVYFSRIHTRSFRGGGLSPLPQTLDRGQYFFQNGTRRQNPLKCALPAGCSHTHQGPTVKIYKVIILQNLALNKRTHGPDLISLILFKLHEIQW